MAEEQPRPAPAQVALQAKAPAPLGHLSALPQPMLRIVVSAMQQEWAALRLACRAAREAVSACVETLDLTDRKHYHSLGDEAHLVFLLIQLSGLEAITMTTGPLLARLAHALTLGLWGHRLVSITFPRSSMGMQYLAFRDFLRALATAARPGATPPLPLLRELVLPTLDLPQGTMLAEALEARRHCGYPPLRRLEGIESLNEDTMTRVLGYCIETLEEIRVHDLDGLDSLEVTLKTRTAAALKKLHFSLGHRILENTFCTIMGLIAEGKAPQLRSLSLNAMVDAFVFESLARVFESGKCPNLTGLVMCGCAILPSGSGGLASLLPHATSLRRLKLSNVTGLDYAALAEALARRGGAEGGGCPPLEEFDLMHMHIADAGSNNVDMLASALGRGGCCESLQTLNIGPLKGYASLQSLSEALLADPQALINLKRVILTCSTIEDLRSFTMGLIARAVRRRPVPWCSLCIFAGEELEQANSPALELLVTALHARALPELTRLEYHGAVAPASAASLMRALEAGSLPLLRTLGLLGPRLSQLSALRVADIFGRHDSCPSWRQLCVHAVEGLEAQRALQGAAAMGGRVLVLHEVIPERRRFEYSEYVGEEDDEEEEDEEEDEEDEDDDY